jgi:hypothetical protein
MPTGKVQNSTLEGKPGKRIENSFEVVHPRAGVFTSNGRPAVRTQPHCHFSDSVEFGAIDLLRLQRA